MQLFIYKFCIYTSNVYWTNKHNIKNLNSCLNFSWTWKVENDSDGKLKLINVKIFE